jgi:hypothetical protein
LPTADGQQQFPNGGQNTLDVSKNLSFLILRHNFQPPLTEGMLLNEHEMADIAGLNAYLGFI